MQIGDLIQVKDCLANPPGIGCGCIFCEFNSSRIGIVVEEMSGQNGCWVVKFDFGTWDIHWTDLEKKDGVNDWNRTRVISHASR